MRRISTLVSILITSFVMTLAGLVASPMASANESGDGSISATFAVGSSVLSNAQKAAIKKALASSGSDATFIVTGTAGKLPGVSDSKVLRLAKKRAKAIKAYLVSLGVSKTRVTTQVKITEIGETPKISNIFSTPAPTPTPTVTAVAAATNSAPAAPAPTYAVGDRGPGGGIVFYVSATNFTSTGSTCNTACKYLEVAPATWQDTETTIDPIYTTVENDRSYTWSTNVLDLTTQVLSAASPTQSGRTGELENWKIGKGFSNTSLMTATSTAKDAVLAYAGTSSAGQWFIPSMNELNELCKYARGQTTGDLKVSCSSSGTNKTGIANDLGGFVDSNYWSSSEYAADRASYQRFDFRETIGSRDKSFFAHVRPVRAF